MKKYGETVKNIFRKNLAHTFCKYFGFSFSLLSIQNFMKLTSKQTITLATLASIGLLLTALGFQYLGGLQPCELCIWQRWPHALVTIVFLGWLIKPNILWFFLGCFIMLVSGSIAGFHWGVENQWWEGLKGCSAPDFSGSEQPLTLDWSSAISIQSCDEVLWVFLGLSMAGWNMLISFCLALLWLYPILNNKKKIAN